MGTTPSRLTSPTVGLRPTTPVAPAGQTIDPSVSVPMATWAREAATAAAEPEEEPQGLRSRTWGLCVWLPTPLHPLVDSSPRKFAHSDRLVLPSRTAPASRSLRVIVASSGRVPSRAREPAVVGRPAMSTLSLSRTGMPSTGLRGPAASRTWSLAAASAAAIGFTASTAPSASSRSPILAR